VDGLSARLDRQAEVDQRLEKGRAGVRADDGDLDERAAAPAGLTAALKRLASSNRVTGARRLVAPPGDVWFHCS
jgi:hypothetical protein